METKLSTVTSGARDSFVTFRNSQGNEARGQLLRTTRYTATFEVYNPYSIVQSSEVLSDFSIYMSDRKVYAGRATVSSLVNTGIMLICEATLAEECWQPDVALYSPSDQREKLREEFGKFLKDCQKIHTILPEFKVAVADMKTLLEELRRWMEHVEWGLRSSPSGDLRQHEQEVLEELREPIIPAVSSSFERFEEIAGRVELELQPAHRSYLQRQLHPLLLCSPFAYRAFQKPLGYPGDYEMVNMIIGNPLEGSSLFAKMVNLWFWLQAPAEAYRNQVKHLTRTLKEEVGRRAGRGQKTRILKLGCGPAAEVQDFMSESSLCDQAHFTLLDFNDETLDYTRRILNELKTKHHRNTELTLEKKSLLPVLRESRHAVTGLGNREKYDLIYCAGLFDYLSDRICKALTTSFYELLAPGGLMLTTNMPPCARSRTMMEYCLEWHLIYRDQGNMSQLAPAQAAPSECRVESDSGFVFLEVRKPL